MRILLIEDDKKIGAFLQMGLEQERYSVNHYLNGKIGLEVALSEFFDLIILDIMLPGLDGFTIIKELRSNLIFTPVIIISGLTDTSDVVNGLESGADDVIKKPFSFDELTARIRALLRRNNHFKSAKLRAGRLIIDSSTNTVYLDGLETNITSKEYQILEYMVRNKNKILSRASIAETIWKTKYGDNTNVIDVYVKKLREKIEKKGEFPIIESIRSVGYRLKDKEKITL